MAVTPKAEIKAVVSVFDSEEFDMMDNEQAAEAIIAAINQEREKTKRFVVVASLKWPDHPDYHMWASGPFNTENQAAAVGQRFVNDPLTGRGNGRWKIVPILPPATNAARTAWDAVRPPIEECCSGHHGWLKDELDQWSWHRAPEGAPHWRYGPSGDRIDVVYDKGGW